MSDKFKVTSQIIKDLGSKRFSSLRRTAGLDGQGVKVGLPKEKDYRGTETPLALVGMVHEFGSPEKGIPERPWLRPGLRSGEADYIRLNRVNIIKIIRGQVSAQVALRQLGVMAVGFVQRYIRNGDFAPLKQATIDRKGSSAPLIDTGQLVQGVTFKVGTEEEE